MGTKLSLSAIHRIQKKKKNGKHVTQNKELVDRDPGKWGLLKKGLAYR